MDGVAGLRAGNWHRLPLGGLSVKHEHRIVAQHPGKLGEVLATAPGITLKEETAVRCRPRVTITSKLTRHARPAQPAQPSRPGLHVPSATALLFWVPWHHQWKGPDHFLVRDSQATPWKFPVIAARFRAGMLINLLESRIGTGLFQVHHLLRNHTHISMCSPNTGLMAALSGRQ